MDKIEPVSENGYDTEADIKIDIYQEIDSIISDLGTVEHNFKCVEMRLDRMQRELRETNMHVKLLLFSLVIMVIAGIVLSLKP